MITVQVRDFEGWRAAARRLACAGVPPEDVLWHDLRSAGSSLFGSTPMTEWPAAQNGTALRTSRRFLELAELVACHRSPHRWSLLYRLLTRLTHETPRLLEIAVDDDVATACELEKSVRRDRHKMRAFIRFRRLETEGGEHFVAWYQSDHYTLPLNGSFFADRFSGMSWTIFTPDDSASWDGRQLAWGPGAPRANAPQGDAMEALWRTYYGRIFNPARVKMAAMKREMPVRFWRNLPEAAMIESLLAEAPARTAAMERHVEGWAESAAPFVPASTDLSELAAAASRCEGCPLCEEATQTVFGEGPAGARLLLVGEQPGDEEDRRGRPFVGPAGRLLREALDAANLAEQDVYLTNAVKHFGFTLRGKRRLHKTPRRLDVVSCRPWLEAELAAVRPLVVVCLGATALQSLAGPTRRLQDVRGHVFATENSPHTIATYHPSAILRTPDRAAADEKLRQLVADLQLARTLASDLDSPAGPALDRPGESDDGSP